MSSAAESCEEEQTRAYGYTRLSQGGRGENIEEQREAIKEYCRETGMRLVTVLNDGVRSSGFAGVEERPRLGTLLDKVEAGACDVVVARDRDRFARHLDIRLELLLKSRASGVAWHLTEEGGAAGIQSPMGAMQEAVLASVSHEKKMKEIERTRRMVEGRIESGEWQGSVPFGLRFRDEGDFLVPDGSKFGEALRIIEQREQGRSQSAVAEAVGVSRDVVRGTMERREQLLTLAEEDGVGFGSAGVVQLD